VTTEYGNENANHDLETQYDPFGMPDLQPYTEVATGLSTQFVKDRLGTFYAGRHFDFEIQASYNRQRWYDPISTRFWNEDPIDADLNLYRYANNSFANATDPSGEIAFVTAAALWGIGSYLLSQAAISAVERSIEYAAINTFGSEQDMAEFSSGYTFLKNFGINVATGGFGGKVKTFSKLGKLAQHSIGYVFRQSLEIAGDTTFDVGYYGRDLNESLLYNSIGSVVGEGVAKSIGAAARKFGRWILPAADEVVTAGPVATSAAGKNFISRNHLQAAAGEFDLIQRVQKIRGEAVVAVNRTVTNNGADVISFNKRTGIVSLWDNKSTIGRKLTSGGRSRMKINPSDTLTKRSSLRKAVDEARRAIQSSSMSSVDKNRAMLSLANDTVRVITRGSGMAKNSVIG